MPPALVPAALVPAAFVPAAFVPLAALRRHGAEAVEAERRAQRQAPGQAQSEGRCEARALGVHPPWSPVLIPSLKFLLVDLLCLIF